MDVIPCILRSAPVTEGHCTDLQSEPDAKFGGRSRISHRKPNAGSKAELSSYKRIGATYLIVEIGQYDKEAVFSS